MAISRAAKIKFLLAIDVLFFFIELVVGYAVGSLALVADSFHMLNDVMSLIVALYAIKLTTEGAVSDPRYTYGWHRAEILAALVNGVFLLALCFSISLEALQRFFSVPEITNPRLVVIVGSWGLASNILGLFLFHEHSHSDGHDHDHKASPTPSKPASITSVNGEEHNHEGHQHSSSQKIPVQSRSRPRSDSYNSLYGHPAATRASLVQTAQDMALARSPSPSRRGERRASSLARQQYGTFHGINPSTEATIMPDSAFDEAGEDAPLLSESPIVPKTKPPGSDGSLTPKLADHGHSHGHTHAGSMNMQALILHVLGDALGNVGVIATGLVIWLTTWQYKYYFDPVISLVITVIIFSSAMPLVRSAAFILLQGVPNTVSLDDVKSSILDVEGVLSLHELHVWQLSETKIVASVHVMASRKHDFMPIASEIRRVLHHQGIHSSTIQPEYYHPNTTLPEEDLRTIADTSCLVNCPADASCDPSENACCPPPPSEV